MNTVTEKRLIKYDAADDDDDVAQPSLATIDWTNSRDRRLATPGVEYSTTATVRFYRSLGKARTG